MRSEAIAWLLNIYGFSVYLLSGGYKKFRNHVLETFSWPLRLNIVGGYTGSGKTEALAALKQQGEKIIDLEEIAKHKGSAFGSIGMPAQPGQEMFENILALELRKALKDKNGNYHSNSDDSIWIEDESQRIGLVNIPPELWKTMRKSPVYFLDLPFETRLQHVTEEYGQLDQEKLIAAIERITQKLGGLNAKNAIQLLKDGKITESFEILLRYYDRFYLKALHNREAIHSLLHTIECKSIIPDNAIQVALSSRAQNVQAHHHDPDFTVPS